MRNRIPPVVATLVLAVLVVLLGLVLADRASSRGTHDVPVVSRSFYAERNGPNATGRICSQVVVSSPAGVGVALSCSYPPAESRIADLLEGAGQ
jgi:hypothetical protein